MKRRNFIKGVGGFIALAGSGVALSAPEVKKAEPVEPFYVFFEKFNGVPINEFQKSIYQAYTKGKQNIFFMGRQVGVSTLLVTMTTWQAFQKNQVLHVSHNHSINKLNRKRYEEGCDRIGLRPEAEFKPIFTTATRNNLVGYNIDTYIHFDDCMFLNSNKGLFDEICGSYKNKIYVTTGEFKDPIRPTTPPINPPSTTRVKP